MFTHFWRLIYRFWRKRTPPLIVIFGPTGTGKTQLSIQLAKHFSGEIISADSMQLYKDLNIVTNKASTEEKQGIPHHLIDFADPLQTFTVVDYRNRALPIIEDLLAKDAMPIIVGGTLYYVESLLYKVLVGPENQGDILIHDEEDKTMREMIDDMQLDESNITREALLARPIIPRVLRNVPSEALHSILSDIDPEMAQVLLPTEKRKIIRSLQVYQKTNKLHSQWIREQKSMKGGNRFGGPLRFTDSVILLLNCDKDVLNERLNARVDKMIENGLVQELIDFHENYNKTRLEQKQAADYTEGIFQSIGFKEFHEYLILSPEERDSESGRKLFGEGVERLKLVTRRYSRIQRKWIRNRFVNADDRPTPDIFELDCTCLDQWDTNVRDKALQIVDCYMQRKPLPPCLQPIKKRDMT